MRRIGITLGEPLGIGPEILVRSLSNSQFDPAQLTIYGSEQLLRRTCQHYGVPTFWEGATPRTTLRSCGPNPEGGEFPKEDRLLRADATLAAIDEACRDIADGRLDAIVTLPIDKSIVRSRLPRFTGHTGYLGEKANVPTTWMLLDNTEIRVVLLTEHIPLRDVAKKLTPDVIKTAAAVVRTSLKEWFRVTDPKLAMVGLNPHAGELVEDSEEERVLKPTIAELKAQGFRIEGPFAADSFFPLARGGGWDAILSPYHDQGLIAAKYPGLDKVVNITLGLPYLRVSPGHGVAYDIAGKGLADLGSFKRTLSMAIAGRL